MKHELTLKQLTADKHGAPVQPKSLAEEHLNGGSFMTLLFVVPGMIMMAVGIKRDDGPNWLLIGLGALAFVYGNLCWHGVYKPYLACVPWPT